MTQAHAAATYQRNAILTASPQKLVKLLYQGAIRNLERSRAGLDNPQTQRSAEVGTTLGKAMSIVGELRASLNHAAGGAIATDLDRLYEFAIDQIAQANIRRTSDGVTNALQVLRTLEEGWDAVIPG